MLMMKEKRIRLPDDRGIGEVDSEGGAIRECEKHGWMKDWADPHARERALLVAREDPPPSVSPKAAVAAIEDVFGSIGDTCPNAPPDAC
jgi:hypothetical protein